MPLRPGGTIAVFDGDYATASVAFDRDDPLQCCIPAFLDRFVHAPWIMRSVSPLLRAAGFEGLKTMSHGYAAVDQPDYMLSVVRTRGRRASECRHHRNRFSGCIEGGGPGFDENWYTY